MMRGGIPPLPVVTVVWCLIELKGGSVFVLRKLIQGVYFSLFVFFLLFLGYAHANGAGCMSGCIIRMDRDLVIALQIVSLYFPWLHCGK
jgi:hypothetical protein